MIVCDRSRCFFLEKILGGFRSWQHSASFPSKGLWRTYSGGRPGLRGSYRLQVASCRLQVPNDQFDTCNLPPATCNLHRSQLRDSAGFSPASPDPSKGMRPGI